MVLLSGVFFPLSGASSRCLESIQLKAFATAGHSPYCLHFLPALVLISRTYNFFCRLLFDDIPSHLLNYGIWACNCRISLFLFTPYISVLFACPFQGHKCVFPLSFIWQHQDNCHVNSSSSPLSSNFETPLIKVFVSNLYLLMQFYCIILPPSSFES